VIRSRGLTKRLPAGIVDASFASLATFAVGLAAVNLLPDAERGVYELFFTAFLLGSVLPRNLIYTPAEVDAVGYPLETRVGLIRRTLVLGTAPALIGATSALLAAAVAAPLTTADVIFPFTATAIVAGILSPLQDHVRKMLHIATRSWLAATISIVQFVVAVTAILILMQIDIGIPWIPFGALSIANLVSLTVGWALTRGIRQPSTEKRSLRFRPLARRGRWLVLQAAAPSIAGFLAAAIITRLASPEALGFAGAARVVAQPILVFASGLTAVMGPRTIEAAMHRDRATARHTSKVYLSAIGLAGIGYLAVAGWSWTLNPMTRLVPAAYEISGLVALTVVANIATAAIFLQINELLGARREFTLAKLSWAISPIVILGAATAGVTDAFARAIGRLGESSTRFVLQLAVIRPQYEPGGAIVSDSAGSTGCGDGLCGQLLA
jgi:O-antigen/teichoic acid export membrane protein